MKLYLLKLKGGEMEQGPDSPVVTVPHTGALERKLHYLIKGIIIPLTSFLWHYMNLPSLG